jgi:hypothetical protein
VTAEVMRPLPMHEVRPGAQAKTQERSINPGGGKSGDPKVGGEGAAPPPGFGCERHLLK